MDATVFWLTHNEFWESRDETLFIRQTQFSSKRETVCKLRSQSKLTYERKDWKSWPFCDMGCHGIPSGLVIPRMGERAIPNFVERQRLKGDNMEDLKKTKSSTHLMTGINCDMADIHAAFPVDA